MRPGSRIERCSENKAKTLEIALERRCRNDGGTAIVVNYASIFCCHFATNSNARSRRDDKQAWQKRVRGVPRAHRGFAHPTVLALNAGERVSTLWKMTRQRCPTTSRSQAVA